MRVDCYGVAGQVDDMPTRRQWTVAIRSNTAKNAVKN